MIAGFDTRMVKPIPMPIASKPIASFRTGGDKPDQQRPTRNLVSWGLAIIVPNARLAVVTLTGQRQCYFQLKKTRAATLFPSLCLRVTQVFSEAQPQLNAQPIVL